MNEDRLRELFRDLREEPVPADSLARVRAGLEERIHRRRWMSPWKIAATVLVAAACAVGVVIFRPAVPVPVAPPMVTQAPIVLPERPVEPAPHPRRTRPRPVEAVPVLIRIETPDPDVVILLVN